MLLNQGDGTFGAPTDYGNGSGDLYAVVAGDFNGDGHLDVAASGTAARVRYGDGTGVLGNAVNVPLFTTYQGNPGQLIFPGTTAADMNGDGRDDLVLSAAFKPNGNPGPTFRGAAVVFTNSDGSFQTPIFYSDNFDRGVTFSAAVGDFNDDGSPDFGVVNDYYNTASFFLNDGSGAVTLSGSQGARNAGEQVFADVDRDGDADRVFARRITGIAPAAVGVALSNGDGTFGAPAFSEDVPGYGVSTGRFNGDNYPDIAATTDSAPAGADLGAILLNQPVDSASPQVTITTPPLGNPHYGKGSTVQADYSCTDDIAVASCVGPVADGSPIDTSSVGSHSFKVTAIDASGHTTQVTHFYVVDPGGGGDQAAPQVTFTTPPLGNPHYTKGSTVRAAYSCSDDVAIRSCTGPVPSGSPIDTSSTGSKSFQVTAVDTAGHTTRTTHFYVVDAAPVVKVNQPLPPVLQTQAKPAQDAIKSVSPKLKSDALIKGAQPIIIKDAQPGSLIRDSLESLTSKGKLISDNGLGVIRAGGADAVAAGGANVVASGGGNVVASGGANVVASGRFSRQLPSASKAKPAWQRSRKPARRSPPPER